LSEGFGNGSKNRPFQTLCVTCANAVPQLCGWVDRGDMSGIEEYRVRMAAGGTKTKPHALYTIVRCANYRKGPLPELPPADRWNMESIEEIARAADVHFSNNAFLFLKGECF